MRVHHHRGARLHYVADAPGYVYVGTATCGGYGHNLNTTTDPALVTCRRCLRMALPPKPPEPLPPTQEQVDAFLARLSRH